MTKVTKVEAQIRDLLHVLQHVITASQLELTDSARAAMARLVESIKTEEEKSAETLNALKDKRSRLIPRRIRLADHKQHLDSLVARTDVKPTAAQQAAAKQISDEYEACCRELAAIEAEITSQEAA